MIQNKPKVLSNIVQISTFENYSLDGHKYMKMNESQIVFWGLRPM